MEKEESTGADRLPSREEDYFSRHDSSSSSRLPPQARRLQSEAVRPRLASIQAPASPTSPRTPRTPLLGRSISSTFNSPGQGFRADDEYFVFEFGSRYLRAGIGGEARPRCKLGFGPDSQTRVGDYSRWLSIQVPKPAIKKAERLETWGADHELWRLDLRDLDLGLVADRIERSLRTAIADHLLVLDDSKKRKFIIAIPPLMPHPLLTALLSTLFGLYPPPPSLVLLSSPVLCAIAAGLRSALVVDIGWAGTLVSAVYEYREVKHKRSCRAMKLLSWEVKNAVNAELHKLSEDAGQAESISFEESEEILSRMVWCRPRTSADITSTSGPNDSPISIPLQSTRPPRTLSVDFTLFSQPPETAFFAREEPSAVYDDHELPLNLLMYNTLLSLPVDVRKACLGRIIITGGGSNIPGLKSRLVDELSHMIAARGWDPVHNYGSAKKPRTRRTTLRPAGATPVNELSTADAPSSEHTNKDVNPSSNAPVHLQSPLPDPVLAAIRSRSAQNGISAEASKFTKETKEPELGDVLLSSHASIVQKLCSIKTLGAWEGASLVAGLRARGLVEVDRDKFLQHGLSSGMRTSELKRQSVLPTTQAQRQSLVGVAGVGGLGKAGERDSGTWTLGAWA